ncbi:MAG: TIGR02597 family protein [Opitutaceae bacterium]|jgi:uncharacterized protein (TIGR02597 family)
MKHPLLIAGLLGFSTLLHTASAAPRKSGVTSPSLGTQYIYIEPNNVTVVAPQYLYTGAGLLTQNGTTTDVVYGTTSPEVVTEQVVDGQIATLTASNNYATGGKFTVAKVTDANPVCTLRLAGDPPKNALGVPLKANQYAYAAGTQPVTYYVLVTAGKMTGEFFSVQGNTADTLLIYTAGVSVSAKDIKAVNLLPYWSLSSLFPASQANIAFIPTTDPSNVMTKLVINPPVILGPQLPQVVGKSYYFSASLGAWVSVDNPSVPAGDTVLPPGGYIYFQNTGSVSFPLRVFISGSALVDPFKFYLTSMKTVSTASTFALPRNTPYSINEMGFNNSNFAQSRGTDSSQRKDELIVDDGHGGVAAIYYRYKNKWYNTDSPVPVTPVFAPGTAFGVKKPANNKGEHNVLLINQSNLK